MERCPERSPPPVLRTGSLTDLCGSLTEGESDQPSEATPKARSGDVWSCEVWGELGDMQLDGLSGRKAGRDCKLVMEWHLSRPQLVRRFLSDGRSTRKSRFNMFNMNHCDVNRRTRILNPACFSGMLCYSQMVGASQPSPTHTGGWPRHFLHLSWILPFS